MRGVFTPHTGLVVRASVGHAAGRMPTRQPSPDLRAIGRMVRRARLDVDITQEALAERCGMHVKAIGEIERGARDPRSTTLVRIAVGLGMTPAELWSRHVPPRRRRRR